jgi:hypothetical protein
MVSAQLELASAVAADGDDVKEGTRPKRAAIIDPPNNLREPRRCGVRSQPCESCQFDHLGCFGMCVFWGLSEKIERHNRSWSRAARQRRLLKNVELRVD